MNFLSGITEAICGMNWDELSGPSLSQAAEKAAEIKSAEPVAETDSSTESSGFQSFIDQFKDKLSAGSTEDGENPMGNFDITKAMDLFKNGCGNFGDLFSMMKDLPPPDKLKDLFSGAKFF